MSSILKSLARNVAKNKMHKKGMRRICSHDFARGGKKRGMTHFASHDFARGGKKRGMTHFASHWREFV